MEVKINEAVQQKICFVFGLEHPLVYTAGLKTEKSHILKDIAVIRARRGGSITLHNPGQLVFYTVLPLDQTAGLYAYIRLLEKSIIKTLTEYGVQSYTREGLTGVWTDKGKIAFIGLGLKKKAIYHGAAINLFNDLDDYNAIKSCGLNEPVTRLADLDEFIRHSGGKTVTLIEFFNKLFIHYKNLFNETAG